MIERYMIGIDGETVKKVFNDETCKIIEENKLLKAENALLQKEVNTYKIRSEINSVWAFKYYMNGSKFTKASDYVVGNENHEVIALYIKLIRHYGCVLVDEVIENMIKEANEEE